MARTRIGTKLGLVSPAMYADYAVLIPQLLEGLPFKVFAASSIDALVHAVESALAPKATPYTCLLYTSLYLQTCFDLFRGHCVSMITLVSRPRAAFMASKPAWTSSSLMRREMYFFTEIRPCLLYTSARL